jgi:hypothetical protein
MKMGFEKGHEKVGGRKKGDANKFTNEFRGILRAILQKEIVELPNTFSSIKSPERRLELILKLLPFAVPKAQEISLEMLSDNKLDFLVETLTNESEREN